MKRKSISISEPLSFAFSYDDEKSIRIRFGVVEVREYNIVPSNNPGGTSGVAIELGWSYIVNQKMPIDNFEEQRSKRRSSNFIEEKRLTEPEREKRYLREMEQPINKYNKPLRDLLSYEIKEGSQYK